MVKKKSDKKKAAYTVDSLSKVVRDISAIRKKEVENDAALSNALCGLADYAGTMFMALLNETIKTPSDMDKKKDMLLVLHLMYLKMSSEILEEEVSDADCNVPPSAEINVSPINTKKGNVPLYL